MDAGGSIHLITPLYDDGLLTPASIQDEKYPLASLDSSYSIRNNNRHGRWYHRLPYIIIAASVLEIVTFVVITLQTSTSLKYYDVLVYDRQRLCREPWRYVTYMLLHADVAHLMLNIFIQCLLAVGLFRQNSSRIVSIYLGGGVIGALGSALFQLNPRFMVGSSAGVYALLISHFPDIILNWEDLKYKIPRVLAVLIIIVSDVIYSVIHYCVSGNQKPQISWASHICGALYGLLLGFVVYKSGVKHVIRIRVIRFLSGFTIAALLIILVVLNFNMCFTNIV